MTGRNLVLCFDGTNNEFGREDTNVVRLARVLDRDPRKQRFYYDPGVGTLPEPGILLPAAKRVSTWLELGFGLGLTRKVREGYWYLMDTWQPGDDVFLFGFSRGAYTARVLAGLLHAVGLLPRGAANLIPYALKYFRRISDEQTTGSNTAAAKKWHDLCADFRSTFARPMFSGDTERHFAVRFVGVWDTVSSVGWVWDPKHFPFTAFNPSIRSIRHAVALDERRAFFRQNLFSTKNPDLIEHWFPGVHSDVGGGYDVNRGRAWRAPFEWIVAEAQSCGLAIEPSRLASALDPTPVKAWAEPLNNSLTPGWLLGEIWPKLVWSPLSKRRSPRINLGRPRFVRSKSVLHETVLQRIRDSSLSYAPSNLSPDLLDAIKRLPSVPSTMAVP